MNLEKIYIISLAASDRTKQIEILNRLNRLDLPFGIPYEIVQAHNGYTEPTPENLSHYTGWNLGTAETNEWWNRDMLPGEIGCAISHLNVYKKMVADEVKFALILEEDFWPVKKWNEIDFKPLEFFYLWDIATLGRNKFGEPDEELNMQDWVIPKMHYNSHAYILSIDGAKKILANPNLEKNLIPSDELLIALQAEHPREDIKKMYPPVLSGIALREDAIIQNRFDKPSTIMGHTQYEILDTSDWESWKAKYLNHTIAKGEYDLMIDDLGNNVFEFQLFTDKFCREAIALAEAEDKWTLDRHEFYPTNDVLLEEIGLNEIYKRVLEEVISPLVIHIWKLEGNGWQPMNSENFLARYTTDRQSHLALHHDFSHITMVVKLNDEFEGGGTWFPKYQLLSNPKRVGMATLHPGLITHLHGARPIHSGRRYICVSFMRNSKH